ncbi:MAG: class I SAM-dependent methyltransferase, partial [Lachnospiraceae bacterium]|nr:class I SAM-dependent methyltransferase [Lachnospiraceae bacterium]
SGIGGRLMQSILAEAPKKTASFKELILGPQSEIPAFRGYLRRNGFRTVNEEMILEDDKYYPIMKVIPGPIDHTETEMTIIADCYGQILLKERHPILLMYLKREQRITVEIIKEINNTRYLNKKSEQKLAELRKKAAELADLIMLW